MADYPGSKPAVPYNPDWGRPVICYIDPEAVGQYGYQMLGAPKNGGTDYRYRAAVRSDQILHLTLAEGQSLSDLWSEQLGARRLRMSIRWHDVSPIRTGDTRVEGMDSIVISDRRLGGDY